MRLLSTDATAKYRLRIISAVKLCGLPKPVVGMVGHSDALTFVAVWVGRGRMASVMQDPEKPSLFSCSTFRHLARETMLEVDMEALDGPPHLVEFLDAVAEWME